MRAGRRNKRITIEVNTPTTGEDGSELDHWTTFATAWAELLQVKGQERFASDQRSALQLAEFRILRLVGVTPKMRVMYKGMAYDIRDVSEVGDNEGVRLICEAREVHS